MLVEKLQIQILLYLTHQLHSSPSRSCHPFGRCLYLSWQLFISNFIFRFILEGFKTCYSKIFKYYNCKIIVIVYMEHVIQRSLPKVHLPAKLTSCKLGIAVSYLVFLNTIAPSRSVNLKSATILTIDCSTARENIYLFRFNFYIFEHKIVHLLLHAKDSEK